MKFSSSVHGAILGLAIFHAEASTLRTGKVTSDKVETSDVRLTILGLASDVSVEDMDIIQTSFSHAYNDIYKPSESSAVSFEVGNSFSSKLSTGRQWGCRYCPDDDNVVAEIKDNGENSHIVNIRMASNGFDSHLGRQWGCRYCPDDDSVAFETVDTERLFKDKLCSEIRSSGSSNLSGAYGCSLSYLRTVVDSNDLVSEACDDDLTLDAQVIVHGIDSVIDEESLKLIATSITAAYNNRFLSTDLMGIGYLQNTVAVSMSSEERSIFEMKIAPLCPKTKKVVDIIRSSSSKTDNKNIQTAFENEFCTLLQNSGIDQLIHARDCTFRFIHGISKSNPSMIEMS
jgi:hypothetical protein